MPIPVLCACKAKLKVADHLLGGKIKCPQCGKGQTVREPDPDHPYYHLYVAAPPPGPTAAHLSFPPPEQVLNESPLSEDERARLENELEDKERLLWTGRPDPKFAFRRGWLLAAAAYGGAVMMLIMVIVFAFVVPFADKWIPILIFSVIGGILFIAGTCYPFYRRWLTAKVFYSITGKRATIWGCNWFGRTGGPAHFSPAELHGIRREPVKSWGPQAGDLIFGSRTVARHSREGTTYITYRWGFLMLHNAVEPEKIIREVLVDPLLDRVYE